MIHISLRHSWFSTSKSKVMIYHISPKERRGVLYKTELYDPMIKPNFVIRRSLDGSAVFRCLARSAAFFTWRCSSEVRRSLEEIRYLFIKLSPCQETRTIARARVLTLAKVTAQRPVNSIPLALYEASILKSLRICAWNLQNYPFFFMFGNWDLAPHMQPLFDKSYCSCKNKRTCSLTLERNIFRAWTESVILRDLVQIYR